jgi:hypothetical protein
LSIYDTYISFEDKESEPEETTSFEIGGLYTSGTNRGKEISSKNRARSDYYEIEDGKRIKVTLPNTEQRYAVFFYDNDKNCISATDWINGDYADVDGAKYVRVVIRNADNSAIDETKLSTYDTYISFEDKESEPEETTSFEIGGLYTSGTNRGKEISSKNRARSDYYEIEDGKRIKVTLPNTEQRYAVFFYDNDKNCISVTDWINGDYADVDGAKYVRVVIRNADNSAIDETKLSTYDTYISFEDKESEPEETTSFEIGGLYTSGTNRGKEIGSRNRARSDYYELEDGKRIKVTLPNSSQMYAVFFYDKDKNCISATDWISGDYENVDEAKYVRVVIRNTDNSVIDEKELPTYDSYISFEDFGNSKEKFEEDSVTLIYIVQDEDNAVKLAWDTISGAEGYEIAISYTKDGEYKTIKIVDENDTSIKDLTVGESYWFKVRAYITVGSEKIYSGYSETVKITLLNATKIKYLYQTSDTSATMEWTSVDDAEGYEVARSVDGGEYEILSTTSEFSYIDKSIEIGKSYSYKVRPYIIINGIKSYGNYSDEMSLGEITNSGTIGDVKWVQYGNVLVFSGKGTIDTTFKGNKSIAKVIIGDGITGINSSAFEGCTSIVEVNITKSMKSVGNYAFKGCTSLETVTFNYNKTVEYTCQLSSGVFADCTSLTDVVLSENVMSIGSSAFDGCSALEELILPENLTNMGYYMIRGTAISSITIPKNVTACSNSGSYNGPLAGCKTLNTVIFEDGMEAIPNYVMACSAYTSYVETVDIPSSVKTIGKYAFYNCKSLSISELPGKVENIEGYAFGECTSIEVINIPKSIKSVGNYAFKGCTNLEAVTFNYNKTVEYTCQLSSGVFADCTSLTDVVLSENVMSIGSSAFNGCSALEELILPENLTSMGYYMIQGTAISSITIPKNVTTCSNSGSYNGPLAGCKTLNTVIFEDGMTTIPAYIMACGGYTSYVETVIIPSSIISIGNYAFYNCNKMTIYGYAGSYAQTYAETNNIPFKEISVLKEDFVEDSVTITSIVQDGDTKVKLEWDAISGAEGYEIAVAYLEDGAYKTTKTVDETDTYIEDLTVGESYWFKVRAYATVGSEKKYGEYSDSIKIILLNTTTIKYLYQTSDTSATIEWTSINEAEGYEVARSVGGGEYIILSTIREVSYIDTSIEEDKSYSYKVRPYITINGIKSYGNYSDETSLGEITNSGSIGDVKWVQYGNVLVFSGNGKIDATFKGNTSIAKVIMEDGITEIGANAFKECTSLTSVGMSDNITSIGNYAFDGCSALEELTLPENLTSMGYYMIRGTDISSITIPKNVTTCGYYKSAINPDGPLSGCEKLKMVRFEDGMKAIPANVMASYINTSYVETVIIPSSVTSIGDFAFYNCDNLTISELPEKLEDIGIGAFDGCTSIEEINIPKSIKSIGMGAFYNCANVKTVTFNYNDEDGYTCKMGNSVFAKCISITSVRLSENITSIDSYTFDGCSALEEMTLPESLTSMGNYMIRGTGISSITIPKNVTTCSFYPNGTGYDGPLAGCETLKKVEFEDGMEAIPAYVMASTGYTSYVETVIIPSSVTSIEDYAFYNCNNMTIYGRTGSYAQKYAEENNIPFKEIL